MKSDTADAHWNEEWAALTKGSKWLTPEPDVQTWAEGLLPGARILDLGAGVGRHAHWLADQGFDVTALDAAPEGLREIDKAGAVKTVLARMDALLRTIAEIRRVLKPGGQLLGTMLSKRRLPHEQQKYAGREIGRNAWVFDAPGTDKVHPHYFCSAAELLAVFSGFECLKLEDPEHEKPGSWHWHMTMERL